MRKLFLFTFLTISISVFGYKDKWDAHKDNWSQLLLSIYKGKTKSFIRLIEQNTDLNYVTPNELELTALDVAILVDNQKAIEALIKTNKISRLNESLYTAAGAKRASTIELLIKHGANPNYANELGHSVLMYATSFGSNEVVECLIKNGANINQTKPNGMNALMLAGYGANIEKLKLLLKLGAKKDLKNFKGQTALDYFNKYCDIRKVSKENKAEIRKLLKY